MTETFTYDVFLSHCANDGAAARDIAERLRRDGLRVWFDEWELKPRERAATKHKKTEQGLNQSQALLLCMSGNVTASDWETLGRQSAVFRDPRNGQRRFIPLRLDDAAIKDTL